jgi:hypothetical protein
MRLNALFISSIVALTAAIVTGCGRGQAGAHGAEQATASPRGSAAAPPAGGMNNGTAPAAVDGKLLTEPTGVDLFFLQYSVSGLQPPFSDLAKLDTTVRSANEFNRDSALAKVEAELRARAEAVRGTKLLQVNLNDSFGQYDTKYKEYDFQMGSGTVIPFYSVFGREVQLALTNGGLAQAWKLEPSEAEEVLQRTGGDRHVMLVLKLQVLDAPPALNDAPMRIDTRVLEYEIRSAFKNVNLGKVIVGK